MKQERLEILLLILLVALLSLISYLSFQIGHRTGQLELLAAEGCVTDYECEVIVEGLR